jgi:DNA-binding XRE family transcriptional regulator
MAVNATMTPQRPRQELIRERVARGLSQRRMAETIGISRNAMTNAEDGGRVKLATAQAIAAHFSRELVELFPEAAGRLTLDVPIHLGPLPEPEPEPECAA